MTCVCFFFYYIPLPTALDGRLSDGHDQQWTPFAISNKDSRRSDNDLGEDIIITIIMVFVEVTKVLHAQITTCSNRSAFEI